MEKPVLLSEVGAEREDGVLLSSTRQNRRHHQLGRGPAHAAVGPIQQAVEFIATGSFLPVLAGMDLSLVVDDFWKLLAGWATERKSEISAFPRLRGIIEAGQTALEVRVAGDKPVPAGWVTVVRFRPTANSELRDFQAFYTKGDRARRKRRAIAQDTVCFQPGLEGGGGERTIYEPWQCVPVEWAKDDAALAK